MFQDDHNSNNNSTNKPDPQLQPDRSESPPQFITLEPKKPPHSQPPPVLVPSPFTHNASLQKVVPPPQQQQRSVVTRPRTILPAPQPHSYRIEQVPNQSMKLPLPRTMSQQSLLGTTINTAQIISLNATPASLITPPSTHKKSPGRNETRDKKNAKNNSKAKSITEALKDIPETRVESPAVIAARVLSENEALRKKAELVTLPSRNFHQYAFLLPNKETDDKKNEEVSADRKRKRVKSTSSDQPTAQHETSPTSSEPGKSYQLMNLIQVPGHSVAGSCNQVPRPHPRVSTPDFRPGGINLPRTGVYYNGSGGIITSRPSISSNSGGGHPIDHGNEVMHQLPPSSQHTAARSVMYAQNKKAPAKKAKAPAPKQTAKTQYRYFGVEQGKAAALQQQGSRETYYKTLQAQRQQTYNQAAVPWPFNKVGGGDGSGFRALAEQQLNTGQRQVYYQPNTGYVPYTNYNPPNFPMSTSGFTGPFSSQPVFGNVSTRDPSEAVNHMAFSEEVDVNRFLNIPNSQQ